jgi:sugar-specific transcriptional regulator TrmB
VSIGGDVEDRVIVAMKQLGFTTTDAKAYVALLKNHPATGYELAARSGVPRSAVYGVLKRLEGLGLVNAVQDKPAKYQPLSPTRFLELVESRFGRTLEDLKESLSRLDDKPTDMVTWTIQGYSQVLEQARALIEGSRKSLYASLWGREAERLAAPLKAASATGIEVVLFSFTPLPPETGRHLSYGISERGLERYWSHKVIMVSDHQRALIGGAERTEDNRAVVTEEAALVEMAISNLVMDITLFGQRTGSDTSEVVSKLTVHLAPVEELLKSAGSKIQANGG